MCNKQMTRSQNRKCMRVYMSGSDPRAYDEYLDALAYGSDLMNAGDVQQRYIERYKNIAIELLDDF